MYSKMFNKPYIKKYAICLIFSFLFILFSSCKNEEKNYSSVYEKQQITYVEQMETMKTPAKTNIGLCVVSILIGIVIGGLIGYAIGHLLYYSPLNDLVMSSGIISTEELFIVLIALAGGFLGFKLSTQKYSFVDEYINVETSFVFSQHESEEIKTLVYGTAANDDASKHFLPRFSSDEEVQLTINMQTSLLEKKIKKLSKFQKSSDILIPVEIKISKMNNLEIKYDGGLQKERLNYETNSSYDTYKFFIKNNDKLSQNIKFLFIPTDKCDVEIDVAYGTPDYKMVDSMCDIAQTVKFIEN